MSDHFTKAVVGDVVLKLRVTPQFKWRRATIENPAWLDDGRDTDLKLACLIWCLLDGEHKGVKTVRDAFMLISDANRKELWEAVSTAWDLSKPEADSKNADSSTKPQPPTSS